MSSENILGWDFYFKMEENRWYVYRHYKKGTNDVFYIGMGQATGYSRAKRNKGRNNLWQKIYSKYGAEYEIVAKNLFVEEAKELEVFLISQYGRIDISTGCLANMTEGAEGICIPH